MRIAFTTLGCKLNQFETDSLATQFQEAGYSIVEYGDSADVYVINSCTVTNRADRKSRNMLYRARRATDPANQASLIVLTGCFVENHRDELESDRHTMVVPNDRKQSIFSLVDGHFKGETIHPAGSVFDYPTPRRIFHTRSMVKVQDGCDNHCTFCIIPAVRGRATSRAADGVTADVTSLVEGGAREIVLTGINMSRYDSAGLDFFGLLQRCLEVPGDFRLRLSSLEPEKLSSRFEDLFDHPKMSPHLHLCAQSASERILLAMRRQYTFAEYIRTVSGLRRRDSRFNITTDMIVGFPGETEDDFRATLDAVGELGFGHVHTFTYSRRSGTRADRMADQVPEATKTERSRRVREAATAERRRYRASLVGQPQRMLVERTEVFGGKLALTGYGQHYVPMRLLSETTNQQPAINSFIDVIATGITDDEDPVLTATLA